MSALAVSGGTKIEWADFTFNPWWGCERVSPGCAHCYAETLSKRRQPGVQLWGDGHTFRFFGDGHWAEPLKWARLAPAKLGRRPRVFCASMADVFEERPELDEHRDRLLALIQATPELDWLILTKRPEFARDWLVSDPLGFEPIPNVWLGVSIENSRFTWRADVLREIPAAVRFISAEPLLGSLYDVRSSVRRSAIGASASDAREPGCPDPGGAPFANAEGVQARGSTPLDLTAIDWVIVGGESGPGARPMEMEWVDQIVANAREHCAAPFVKQLGSVWAAHVRRDHGIPADPKGGSWDHWPDRLRIREFPRSAA